jgi:FAD synthetase
MILEAMNNKKVLIFGTFDGLHPGHLHFIQSAAKLGDELHVVVALNQTVQEVKSKTPKLSEQDRISALEAIPEVTSVTKGYTDDKYRIIEEIKPDVIALGYDQTAFTEKLEEEIKNRGLDCEIVRLDAFEPNKFKSSLLN